MEIKRIVPLLVLLLALDIRFCLQFNSILDYERKGYGYATMKV
jgi:hypothetical protein